MGRHGRYDPLAPPVAAKKPSQRHPPRHHGQPIDYAWLRDPGYPKVDDEEVLAHLEGRERLVRSADGAAQGDWSTRCSRRCARGSRKPTSRCRKRTATGSTGSNSRKAPNTRSGGAGRSPAATAADQLILDENALAEGQEYFRLGAFSVSKDGQAARLFGRRQRLGTLHRADQGSRRPASCCPTKSPARCPAWSGSRATRGSSTRSPTSNWRTDNARLHWLGTAGRRGRRALSTRTTRASASAPALSAQRRLADHRRPATTRPAKSGWSRPPTRRPSRCWSSAREKGVEYDVDVRDGDALHPRQRRRTRTSASPPRRSTRPATGQTLIEGRTNSTSPVSSCSAISTSSKGGCGGLDQIEMRYYDDPARIEPIDFPEASYTAGLSNNPEYEQTELRLSYESMVTPGTVYDYHVADQRLELLKRAGNPLRLRCRALCHRAARDRRARRHDDPGQRDVSARIARAAVGTAASLWLRRLRHADRRRAFRPRG